VGGAATAIDLSSWIIVMTFLLALFIALAKRRDDVLHAAAGRDVRAATAGPDFRIPPTHSIKDRHISKTHI